MNAPLTLSGAEGRAVAHAPLTLSAGPSGPESKGLLLALALLLASSTAFAEAGVLASHGRVPATPHFLVWGGTDSLGVGALTPAGIDLPGHAWSGELLWQWKSRVVEARMARLFPIRQHGLARVSAFVGASTLLVPEGQTDFGLGPNGGLTLTLGGERFWVDLGLQTAVEVFIRSVGPRFPQRAVVAANLRLGSFTLSLMARTGADLEVRRAFVGRGEVMFAIGYLGSPVTHPPGD